MVVGTASWVGAPLGAHVLRLVPGGSPSLQSLDGEVGFLLESEGTRSPGPGSGLSSPLDLGSGPRISHLQPR